MTFADLHSNILDTPLVQLSSFSCSRKVWPINKSLFGKSWIRTNLGCRQSYILPQGAKASLKHFGRIGRGRASRMFRRRYSILIIRGHALNRLKNNEGLLFYLLLQPSCKRLFY